ncbi:hypothetical protein [Candidatus Hecatella orcuttiae]|jgi:nucleolar protein 56|uniref:hypothetical protein n=1 Tax=Candidatus Hecatella orcuttiae TaxID=1935119 RepID=UPI00286811A6|nr:hypothetical protein [Candidatus Hecatella orcuttiae]
MGKVYLVDSVIGVLAFDEAGKVVDKVLFPKDPEKAAERILSLEGKVDDAVRGMVQRLKGSCEGFIVENSNLASGLREQLGVEVAVEKSTGAGEFLRSNLAYVAVQVGYAEREEEVYDVLREVSTAVTRVKIRRAAGKRDKIIIQAINAVDELDKALNILAGRLREWYGLHFPELDRAVESHETYARLVETLGLRENFNAQNLIKLGLPESKSKKLEALAQNSVGAPLLEEDLKSLQLLCKLYSETWKTRKLLAEKAESLMEEVAPNLKALVGASLGSRMLALSGGLEKMAMMPASKLQVLGAEKALFRSLKTGARPPKHGVLFQHPLVHQAPRWQRGKMARALAGKIAIASRVDALTGSDVGARLKAELERRVKEIREKYKKPPVKPPKAKKPKKGKGRSGRRR